jgi:hypothetical protein
VKASEEGEAKRLEFLKTLRELISRKGGSERDVLEWHGNGGQSFREGEATPIKVNGRRFVTVILWSVDLNLPGDFPIRLLLLGGDGSILDQVDCFGEAFYVRLGAAASDSSVGESAAVYVSASFERKDWKGSLFVIHGSERLEIPFPRAGQEEKESVNGVTFLKIGISKDRFETPDLIR